MVQMTSKPSTFPRAYRTALRRYLKSATPESLKAARTIGRRCVREGLGTLDLAVVHEKAVIAELAAYETAKDRDQALKRAGAFFAEAMLPLEATHRSALEANGRLERSSQDLRKRTRDLATSNRKLQREIARRLTTEVSLRESEREAARLLGESRRMQEQLRLLSRRILSVQEEERKRISRDLHDVVAQMLASIQVRLDTLKKEAAADARNLGRKVSSTQRLVERSVNCVHKFARNLRPAVLDNLGLVAALHAYATSFSQQTGIRVTMVGYRAPDPLSAAKRTALFRVAQETLANVARHAKADQVRLTLRKRAEAVTMRIQDDGCGFDAERMWTRGKGRNLGLLGMRERIEMVRGTFTVTSAPGQGATIEAKIPIRNGNPRKGGSP